MLIIAFYLKNRKEFAKTSHKLNYRLWNAVQFLSKHLFTISKNNEAITSDEASCQLKENILKP